MCSKGGSLQWLAWRVWESDDNDFDNEDGYDNETGIMVVITGSNDRNDYDDNVYNFKDFISSSNNNSNNTVHTNTSLKYIYILPIANHRIEINIKQNLEYPHHSRYKQNLSSEDSAHAKRSFKMTKPPL